MSRLGRAARRLLVRVYLHGLLLIALTGVASTLVADRVLRPAMSRRIDAMTSWMTQHMAAVRGDPARLSVELGALREGMEIEMSLYDERGALLGSSADPPLAPLPEGEARRLASGATLPLAAPHEIAVGLFERGARVGHAVVRRPPPALPLGRLWVVLLVVLVVIAVASIPLARSVARPLERLRAVTRAFGAGDLHVRTGIRRQDEIGDLARAFDEMAERLLTLRRSEKELLANVSHELRTPLARIRVVLDLAEDGDPARLSRCLGEIAEDLGELERLVDDVLTTARLDLAVDPAGLPRLKRERVDAAALVEGAAGRFRARSPERALVVESSFAAPVSLDADPALLRRAIDNLLDNAQKYSDEAAPVTLRARAGGDGGAVIEVEDRGVGIAEEDRPHLFRPFFRGDRSRTRATGGVGLGLALARRIVDAHGGQLELESRLGEGTTARIALPAAAADGDLAADSAPRSALPDHVEPGPADRAL